MKHITLLISLFTLLAFPLFANDAKHYCSPDQIELNNTTILVHLDTNTVEVDTLFADQGGIYFNENGMRCLQCRRTLNPKNTCECPVWH